MSLKTVKGGSTHEYQERVTSRSGRRGWLSGAEDEYRSLGSDEVGSDEVTLRNYRPVGLRKGNMSLSDPLAAGVSLTFINPASSVVLGYDLDLGSSAKLDF
jgi:hypothetical protein